MINFVLLDPSRPEVARLVAAMVQACFPISNEDFANFDPPQTFALRADEILGNERQTVWRSGRALQA
jgi:hypothetical protein